MKLFNRESDVETTPDVAPAPAAEPATTAPARFDADVLAEQTLAEHFTDRHGRHTVLHRPGPEYWQPDVRGRWGVVPRKQIRNLLAMTGHAAGHRMLPVRLEAAQIAFARILAHAPDEMLPVVDAAAVATPDRPGQPPANWPVEVADWNAYADVAKVFVAQRMYTERGRELIYNDGRVWCWDLGAWQSRDGSDEWLADLLTDWAGQKLPIQVTSEVRRVLAFRGDRRTATPAEVADLDARREIAGIEADAASMLRKRGMPSSMGTFAHY